MKKIKKRLQYSGAWLAAFLLWTAAVCFVDVQPIGPQASPVGLAAVNLWAHRLTGVHLGLYRLTDLLSLLPLGICVGFGLLGLTQWMRRKSLLKVDGDLLALGGFYLLVIGAFAFFEVFVVNCRPLLIEGRLEASYPSSTTMLVLCVMSTAAMQLNERVKSPHLRRLVLWGTGAFTAFMVLGRLVSGVHWLTDIIGGGLLSGGLVALYAAVAGLRK